MFRISIELGKGMLVETRKLHWPDGGRAWGVGLEDRPGDVTVADRLLPLLLIALYLDDINVPLTLSVKKVTFFTSTPISLQSFSYEAFSSFGPAFTVS